MTAIVHQLPAVKRAGRKAAEVGHGALHLDGEMQLTYFDGHLTLWNRGRAMGTATPQDWLAGLEAAARTDGAST